MFGERDLDLCAVLSSGNGGTGPPDFEKRRFRRGVKYRPLHGPAGGSHGHAARFSSGGT